MKKSGWEKEKLGRRERKNRADARSTDITIHVPQIFYIIKVSISLFNEN